MQYAFIIVRCVMVVYMKVCIVIIKLLHVLNVCVLDTMNVSYGRVRYVIQHFVCAITTLTITLTVPVQVSNTKL